MTKRGKKDKVTRKSKQQEGKPRQINEKHQQTAKKTAKPLVPLNEKQQEYITSIYENPLTIATGYAGTSKTYCPTVIACDMYQEGLIEQIVLTRPNVSSSKTLGAFKGSLVEKMSHWLLPVMAILHERLGKNKTEYLIEHGDITFVPLEVIKGCSFNNCFVICDEAEDLTPDEFKKVVTRLGKDSKMVFAGDLTQADLRTGSGLDMGLRMAKKYDSLGCGWVDFNSPDDIVRSDTVKQWILAFNEEEKAF